jgi:hypothetical protein
MLEKKFGVKMIIIVDYFLYNIDNASSKKFSAELNINNGLLKVQREYFSEEGKPELVICFFDESITIYLENYVFDAGQDGLYYTTFLSEDDLDDIFKKYLKYKFLFNEEASI